MQFVEVLESEIVHSRIYVKFCSGILPISQAVAEILKENVGSLLSGILNMLDRMIKLIKQEGFECS